MRIGLRELLSRRPEMEIVTDAGDLSALQVSEIDTDVLVLAAVAPAQLGSQLQAWPAVLLLTTEPADVRLLAAARVTATGSLPLEATPEELAAAVHALAEGLWVSSPGLVQSLAISSDRERWIEGQVLVNPLTGRETEILQQIALGLANKQIAFSLGISEHTVKFHLSSLYAKMGVGSRTEAVRAGLSLGLISL
jgi:DNA-binding NarL/FixJ family response regulator